MQVTIVNCNVIVVNVVFNCLSRKLNMYEKNYLQQRLELFFF